jgi:C_GCAxxG_C_C family probable redox protein
MTLQEAYDLPGGELVPWIANGFQGGVCVGEICGALSGGAMCLSLMGYKAMDPKNDYARQLVALAIMPYMSDLVYAFNNRFGSVRCAILTKHAELGPVEVEKRMRLRLWEESCTPFVEYVVTTLVRWGEISQEPPTMPDLGQRLPTLR